MSEEEGPVTRRDVGVGVLGLALDRALDLARTGVALLSLGLILAAFDDRARLSGLGAFVGAVGLVAVVTSIVRRVPARRAWLLSLVVVVVEVMVSIQMFT